MNEIVLTAKTELENMSNAPTGNHLKTGDIRKLSAKLFKSVKGKSKDYVFTVCGELLVVYQG